MEGALHQPEDTHNEPCVQVKGNIPMKVAISHTKVKPDKRAEIEAAGKRVLEALERERPQGFLYAVCPLPDGETFVTLSITDDGVDNPILAFPEYQAFAGSFKTWIAEPPTARSEERRVGKECR